MVVLSDLWAVVCKPATKMRLNVFLWLPHVSLAPTLLTRLYIDTHLHADTPKPSTGLRKHWIQHYHSTSCPPPSSPSFLPSFFLSWLFSPLPSSVFNLSHSRVALSPPTLLPASSLCQLTALNTRHLIRSPNVPLFLLACTSCSSLFLLISFDLCWFISYSPLPIVLLLCVGLLIIEQEMYILCVGSMCVLCFCGRRRRMIGKLCVCVSVFMALGDSGVTAHEAEIRF